MKKYFFIFLFLLINILSSKDNNNLLVFKFKTYYNESINDNSNYTSEDFMKKYLLSKVYIELESGNKNEFERGKNQILRAFLNSKANIFIFRDFERYNNLVCKFNTTLSESYYFNMKSPQFCESEQIFRINTDFGLKEYLYNKFFIDNYFCLNDSLCADVGVDIQKFPTNKKQDFSTQLTNLLNSSEHNFCLYYLDSTKEEGLFTFGIMPHNYSKDYNENNLISFYTQPESFSITFDGILLNEKDYSKKDEKYDPLIKFDISLDKEGIGIDRYYFDILKEIYFNYYIEKGACKIYHDGMLNKIIYCYDAKFGINDIKKFPKIKFVKYSSFFNVTFDGEELFYYKGNKYFCKIYCKFNSYKMFVVGRILLKKYLTVFNADKKQIYFYNKIPEEKIEENNKSFFDKYKIVIIIIAFIVLILIIYSFGILTGKCIYKKRKKKANELDDNYDYKTDKENNGESLYNPIEDDE